mmetsp:Transcript_3616/g.6391  ORF Transcript_3616/g.6391 Transcript_3616/m.6391 type:complete len:128 (+) Transcript_3616:11-394(+)
MNQSINHQSMNRIESSSSSLSSSCIDDELIAFQSPKRHLRRNSSKQRHPRWQTITIRTTTTTTTTANHTSFNPLTLFRYFFLIFRIQTDIYTNEPHRTTPREKKYVPYSLKSHRHVCNDTRSNKLNH